MIAKVRSFFSVRYDYAHPDERRRANSLWLIVWLAILLWGVAAVPLSLLFAVAEINVTSVIILVVPPLWLLGVAYLLQSGRLTRAALLFVIFFMPFVIFSIRNHGIDSPSVMSATIPLVLSGLLLTRRWFISAVVVIILTVSFLFISELRDFGLMLEPRFLSAMLAFVILTVFLYLLNNSDEPVIQRALDAVEQLQRVGHFPASLTAHGELQVYVRALTLIRVELGYDFAQIFFPNDRGDLTRRLRISQGVAEGYVLTDVRIDDINILTQANRTGQPALITMSDDRMLRTHFLSPSRFGIAMPVHISGRVGGVIDVQSTQIPLTQMDVTVLAVLADVLGTMVIETRTRDALEEQVANQESVMQTLRSQLRELKQVGRDVVGSDWATYLERRHAEAIGFNSNLGQSAITPASDLPSQLRKAMETGAVHVETENDEQVVYVPLILQGEVLGAMSFMVDGGRQLTDRELEVAESVARRLAIALENRRLFEQSRSQALRERKAGEIASLLISATDVDSVLTLAADSFNEALGAVSTRIHLQPGVLTEREYPMQDKEVTGND